MVHRVKDEDAFPNVPFHDGQDTEMLVSAAVKIQATYRGHCARFERVQEEKSARAIQAHFRGHRARQERRKEANAAVRIQANFRGSKTRQNIREQQAESPLLVAALLVPSSSRTGLAKDVEVKPRSVGSIDSLLRALAVPPELFALPLSQRHAEEGKDDGIARSVSIKAESGAQMVEAARELTDKAVEYVVGVPSLLRQLDEYMESADGGELFPNTPRFETEAAEHDESHGHKPQSRRVYPNHGFRAAVLASLHLGVQDGSVPYPWESQEARDVARRVLTTYEARLPLARRHPKATRMESLASDLFPDLCLWAQPLFKKCAPSKLSPFDEKRAVVTATCAALSIAWAASNLKYDTANECLPLLVPCVVDGIKTERIDVQRSILRSLACICETASREVLAPCGDVLAPIVIRSGILHDPRVNDWACLAAVYVSVSVGSDDITSSVVDEMMEGLTAAGENAIRKVDSRIGSMWLHAMSKLADALGLRMVRYMNHLLPIMMAWLVPPVECDSQNEVIGYAAQALTETMTWAWPRFLGRHLELRELRTAVEGARARLYEKYACNGGDEVQSTRTVLRELETLITNLSDAPGISSFRPPGPDRPIPKERTSPSKGRKVSLKG